MTAATDGTPFGDGQRPAAKPQEPSRKARPSLRFTAADQRAVDQMLDEEYEIPVGILRSAIWNYERTLLEAKERLGRRRPVRSAEVMVQIGRLDAMNSVLALIDGMWETGTENPYRILGAVIDTAHAEEAIYYASPKYLWPDQRGGDAS